mmetsp:Transcript_18167/g.28247  ORF Transcript_18167/g.28247 Transcript_18167/m.28247 type:complete len:224 (-) Transcript_18167:176-847(-)
MMSHVKYTGQVEELRSEGICDGFGTCQCAPPFIGDDCSMRDCKDKCNYNGYCSAEYPVSRCICNQGYFGDACQYIECLNNCTHPDNGECDHLTGTCKFKPLYSPQVIVDSANSDEQETSSSSSTLTRNDDNDIWGYWEGEDCSWISVWAAGWQLLPQRQLLSSSLCIASVLFFFKQHDNIIDSPPEYYNARKKTTVLQKYNFKLLWHSKKLSLTRCYSKQYQQ